MWTYIHTHVLFSYIRTLCLYYLYVYSKVQSVDPLESLIHIQGVCWVKTISTTIVGQCLAFSLYQYLYWWLKSRTHKNADGLAWVKSVVSVWGNALMQLFEVWPEEPFFHRVPFFFKEQLINWLITFGYWADILPKRNQLSLSLQAK